MHKKEDENHMLYIPFSFEKFLFLLYLSVFLFLPVSSQAKVSGPCSNCHTMHNSQSGTHMQYLAAGETDTGPKDALLRGTCLGCHSSTDGTIAVDVFTGAPIVFNSVEPSYNSAKGLAAGNFFYMQNAANDANGHNVLASNPEDNLTEAPGRWTGTCGTNSCHYNIHGIASGIGFSGLDGRQGCTKCHMVDDTNGPKGFHHKDDTGLLIDSFAEGWYRFLKGHQGSSTLGVTGIEDDDWEEETSTDHNEYLGSSGNKDAVGSFQNLGNTMTAYCCGCHGNFHIEDSAAPGASPWIRHPSDSVLPNSGEYTAYTTYNPLVPVARPDLGSYTGSSNEINPGEDLVMCLSCHRAHASPYFKMMRWDYRGWPGNAGTSGCSVCHTSKD